jgi:energy-coupling factor transporter ATP-binding protein EcfA2
VALGRAMVRNPAVFLLDEPLSNLDAKLRNTMRAEIALLHKRLGTTFVYVTHDQTEAMTMGDRIVVMKDGYIQQVDTPQNLYDKPCNLFVAGFIGTPQMNFLPATVLRRTADITPNFPARGCRFSPAAYRNRLSPPMSAARSCWAYAPRISAWTKPAKAAPSKRKWISRSSWAPKHTSTPPAPGIASSRAYRAGLPRKT